MKNNVIFSALLLLGFASARAELTYMDGIKSSIDAHGFHLDNWNSIKRGVDSDIIHRNAIPLYLSAVNLSLRNVGQRSERLEKVIKYNAWYNQHHMLWAIDDKGEFKRYNYGSREVFRKALIAEAVEPVIFLKTHEVVGKIADAASETETGKAIAQIIPQQHHQFVKENGTIVLSALVARGAGTVAKGESLSENAQAFGKSAFMHVGSNVLGEYVINPSVDKLMGPEDSYKKDGIRFLANIAGLGLVHVGVKKLVD